MTTYLLQDAGVGAELSAEGCEHADHGAAAVDDLRGQTRKRHGLCAGRINVSTSRTMTPFTAADMSAHFAVSQAGEPGLQLEGLVHRGTFGASKREHKPCKQSGSIKGSVHLRKRRHHHWRQTGLSC